MLTVGALLAPPHGTGRLAVSLFAPETVTDVANRVRAYLGAAYADLGVAALSAGTAQDVAAAAYVYAEAYQAKADLMHDEDASVTEEGGAARSFAPDQRAYWASRAAHYRAEYDAAVTAGGVATAATTWPTITSKRGRFAC